jgi:dihydroorotate dehydrogenase
MYPLLRNMLFLFPAEGIHHLAMSALNLICRIGFIKKIIASRFCIHDPGLKKELWGLSFKNPLGLGAGFDKNASYLSELEVLGFGFIEIGTVTPLPQAGNEKPRLFRLKKDRALINRMGFNNDGVKIIAGRLRTWKKQNSHQGDGRSRATDKGVMRAAESLSSANMLIGGNIGKNKSTPNEDAWKDYDICFRELFDCVDYFVVNVSSPNTPGLRELQEKEALRKIIVHLQTINSQQIMPKPLLLKIAPDLSWQQIDDVIDLATEIQLDGLVATNTTISREQLQTTNLELQTIGSGGLSGLPLKERSTSIVNYIHTKTAGRLPIIASGGIFTAADAKEKIAAGASLVQVWTGFIYEGPAIARSILTGLKS